MDDRRRYERVAVDWRVQVRCGDGVIRARSRNISQGGICVESGQALSGDSFSVIIEPGTADELVIEGQRCWTTAHGQKLAYGVEFRDLDESALTKLVKLIDMERPTRPLPRG